jgi:sec-independent protein translocase protein TatC
LGTKGLLVTKPTLSDYFDNLSNIILGCGLAFELPVLSYILTRIGIVTPKLLRDGRRYAVVIILIVAAFITPSPDWMSQFIVFTPLWVLYELSVLISAWAVKDGEKKQTEEWV